jgi:hypothetical protein
MFHRTCTRELHGAGGAEVVHDAASAAGAVKTGESKHLPGDEAARLIGVHASSNGRRKRRYRRDRPQHNTRKHAQLRTNPAAGYALSLYLLLTILTMATLKQHGW